MIECVLYCFFIFSLLRDYFFSFLSLRFLNVELNYRTNLRFRAAWLAFVRILKSRNARRVCIRGCRLKSTERFNNKNKQFACLAPEMLLLYVLALNFTLARKYTIYILRIISKNLLLSFFFFFEYRCTQWILRFTREFTRIIRRVSKTGEKSVRSISRPTSCIYQTLPPSTDLSLNHAPRCPSRRFSISPSILLWNRKRMRWTFSSFASNPWKLAFESVP